MAKTVNAKSVRDKLLIEKPLALKVPEVKSAKAKSVKAAPKKQTAEQFLIDIQNKLAKNAEAKNYNVAAEIGNVCSTFKTTSLEEANQVVSALVRSYMLNNIDDRDFYVYLTASDGKALCITEA